MELCPDGILSYTRTRIVVTSIFSISDIFFQKLSAWGLLKLEMVL